MGNGHPGASGSHFGGAWDLHHADYDYVTILLRGNQESWESQDCLERWACG